MAEKARFEVCVFNVQSCIIAENCGAYRVELCENPVEGGTTPSYGQIRRARERVSIKLYPIIRPRCGNYYYTEDELAVIQSDIAVCKELGCDGISIGAQKINGEIDIDQLKQFVEWAYPMGVTCNRAFDATPDPFKALEDLIAAGCERVLTSGQKRGAPEAGELLGKLVQMAGNRIIIMPGAGITAANIKQLMAESGAKEYHGSVRKATKNPMSFANPNVLDFGNVYVPDEMALKAIIACL
ncbi:copper homeostasis protein CutC [Flavihumibacter fluvii]|uniref:copper homeostasis protein CutC n=1 Tax=Flavihumibacter fluvii TaxID=2838157 RepID=UPI001BDE96F9|nr:copper homeostasis protein CutC [Flavihumibacter fluvii]ULQ52011.1 copper homeostasis protein CutC [Flavihumibacter fluvii]